MQNLNEIQEFLLFFCEGILIGIIFDFFRSLRRIFDKGDIATYIEDFVFLCVSGIIQIE